MKKIYCEKCGQDITVACNSSIENYTVGRVECPNCHNRTKRYISEGDILLFFGISETLYMLFTYAAIFVFDNLDLGLVSLIILFGFAVIYFFLSKLVSTYIFINAPFKEKCKNRIFDEDASQIKKSITWQFLLFFAIAVSTLSMEEDFRIYFIVALPFVCLITFVKFYFQQRYENNKK